jgi:hypothetical protein
VVWRLYMKAFWLVSAWTEPKCVGLVGRNAEAQNC